MGKKPKHPGEILRHMYMVPLGLSVSALAEHLLVSRKTVSNIVNGHTPITENLALRLSRAFDTTPALWSNLQQMYNLWEASQDNEWKKVKPLRNSDAA